MRYKLSLVLLSMLPALSHAGGNFNFYGKAGIDLTSRFETMKITENHDSDRGFKLSIPQVQDKTLSHPVSSLKRLTIFYRKRKLVSD
ncbi:hypothetical protein V4937_04800 [Histophilus somni]